MLCRKVGVGYKLPEKFGELLKNFEEMCFNKDVQPRFLKAASRCLGIWNSTFSV